MHAIVFVFILSLVTIHLAAQEKSAERKATYSIETDFFTFGFNGFAFHMRIKPKNGQHLLIGVGTYALDFPYFLVDLNEKNKDKGWNMRINSYTIN